MVPKLVSSETVFDAVKLAVSFAPVPGLEAAVVVVEMIYKAAKDVQLHEAKCKSLGDAAVAVMETIRDNSPTAEPSKLDKTVQKTLSFVRSSPNSGPLKDNLWFRALEDAKRDVEHWSQYTVVQSFYYRHDIEDSIQEHGDSMSQCLTLLGVAAALQMNDVALILKKGREEDSGKLDEILENQKIMMQSLTELHEMLQDLPVQSHERSKASNALLQLRKDEVNLGKVGELPSELKGECVKISHAWSGNRCDIWKGLRLDQEVVALKFYRVYQRPDDQGKNKEAIEIVQGLQYLHSRELLHGDVKPSNILIDDGGHVQLGDFTLLRALAMDDHGPLNSQSSCDLASLRYQPPEVMKAEKVTPAADVYSWAMSFLVIASGGKCIPPSSNLFRVPDILKVQPFPKHTRIPQLLALITAVEVPKLEDYPSSVFTTYPLLWALLGSCWNKEPTARPSATDLLQSLNLLKAQA
ncbi:hypothetical protein FRC04_007546 [Tulasnella sp. 424]|nr:hypothetical protein FRC04_007546 [Tulasnella sp. 424]KAG8978981.1 hypothetical protein FRC05_009191 [Tulasnella sp. 425]